MGKINAQSLEPSDQLILLRVVKQAKDMKQFGTLVSRIRPEKYSAVEKMNLIYLMKKNKDLKSGFPSSGVSRLVNRLIGDLSNELTNVDLLTRAGIIVTDITDALDGMASLRISLYLRHGWISLSPKVQRSNTHPFAVYGSL
jgi:hypothetical protein